MSTPVYEWHIVVRHKNTYGDRIDKTTPTIIRASTRSEVTKKVRAAYDATYDDFRKFWSHDWVLTEMREVDQ